MNKLININELKETRRTFSGNAGAKIGVIFNNEEYVVKYPKNISKMKNVEIKYSTSSLSEYIGSHIYQILGYPVHETLLGYDNDKLVVLCKNFDLENKFHEFKSVANRLRSKEIEEINFIDGNALDVKEIIKIINVSSLIKDKDKTIERFFDMFIIDYLLNNNDRNNTNWGFMIEPYNLEAKETLAPIYDCGNSFDNKLSDRQIQERLNNEEIFNERCVDGLTCSFSLNGHQLNFKDAFSNDELLNLGLKDALKRNVMKIVNHFDQIEELINDIPEEENGVKVLTKVYKEFIIKSLSARLEKILIPAYQEVVNS